MNLRRARLATWLVAAAAALSAAAGCSSTAAPLPDQDQQVEISPQGARAGSAPPKNPELPIR
ncbi:MAG: hypothetical protein C0501_04500 [Isosphaera sp.]|nr:hypothetical protein [Isosphaera sp.]